MTLGSGRYIGYEYDRMIVLFSMQDGGKEIPCAISTTAMDYLERGPQIRPEQREAQFVRLRDRIEARAASTSMDRAVPTRRLEPLDRKGTFAHTRSCSSALGNNFECCLAKSRI